MGRRLASLIVAAAAAGACGGQPTEPSQAPTLVALVIESPTDRIEVGWTLALSAVARLSDGTSGPVEVTWSSDNSAAATVDNAGRVQGIRLGAATITASAGDQRASRLILVMPSAGAAWKGDFSGTWGGTTQLVNCTWVIHGPGPNPCPRVNGGTYQIHVELTQKTNAVAGELTWGATLSHASEGSVCGWVDATGVLFLQGTLRGVEDNGTARVVDWVSQLLQGNREQSGHLSLFREFGNAFGQQGIRYDLEITGLTRESG